MLKSAIEPGGRRKRRSPTGVEVPDSLEGHIEEICRDLAVQVKRMKQLQERADELRTAFRARSSAAERTSTENR